MEINAIKTYIVGGENWNKFIETLDTKNSKLNKTGLLFCERCKIKGKWKEIKLVVNVF